jgi:ATP-dependent exoDNAse (exonuclease V) alpha subunit
LTEQVRQQGADQVVFRGLLDRLRMGEPVRNDWNILQQRMISPNTNAERARLDRSVHIQANLNDVKKANAEKLEQLATNNAESRTCRINALEEPARSSYGLDDEDFAGLQKSVYLARGSKVMITSNIWVEHGVVNGTIGYVREIIFAEGAGPPSLPICVIVELPNTYTGPSIPGLPFHVVIEPRVATALNKKGVYVDRHQLPLRVCYSITIHKLSLHSHTMI